ncbi:hypothetical protein LMG31506_02968 [Cupriavidus yeoncheonensis]|uniref:DNA (cytosine-5-)-methyltransferase n=2 Tax=Cupriavidus yeoncheonensis TaxID=1462994 RepID=A0A916N4P6_9BURK|nr:hypothetical protein LMG31506_02968 [Cupriavidus yeoncheonensis]
MHAMNHPQTEHHCESVWNVDPLGLVMVAGEQFKIADIGMRMLVPPKLYQAQGFPSTYVFAPIIDPADPTLAFLREAPMCIGKMKAYRLPQHAQIRMCGNSVSPPMAAALVSVNVPGMASWSAKESRRFGVAA